MTMKKVLILLYGVVAYLLFLASFLYAIGFVWNAMVPKSIDSGEPGPLASSLLINVALLGLFGIQHSIMARPAFKAWWTQFIHPAIERSTFVLLTSLILGLIFWQWRPLPEPVFMIENGALRGLIFAISALGWGIVLLASFLIDHFDLFGLSQVHAHWQGREHHHKSFKTPMLYGIVRHPLMLGFFIAFWFTPDMTQGHLLFAAVVTAYVLVAIQIEERDLVKIIGADYVRYQQTTPMLIPFMKPRRAPAA